MTNDPTTTDLAAHARRHAEDLDRTARRLEQLNTAAEWDKAEDVLDELREQPLEVARIITYRVTLGTGGPAYGVDFHADGTAAAWHQDWFTERVYADLAPSTVDTLRDAWNIDLMDDEDRERGGDR